MWRNFALNLYALPPSPAKREEGVYLTINRCVVQQSLRRKQANAEGLLIIITIIIIIIINDWSDHFKFYRVPCRKVWARHVSTV